MNVVPRQFLRSKFATASMIAITVFAAVAGARQAGWLQALELGFYDTVLRMRPPLPMDNTAVVLIRATEIDLQRHGYPLSDAVLADVLRKASRANPAAIGVDLLRDMPVGQGYGDLESVVTGNPRIVMVYDRRIAPPTFLRGEQQLGFADLKEDLDGVIRRALLMNWDAAERRHFSLALTLAFRYLDPEAFSLGDAELRIGDTVLPWFGADDGGYRRADDGGYQFLLDYRRGTLEFPSLTISQILDGEFDPAVLEGKIALLSVTAPSVHDLHETPFTSDWRQGSTKVYGVTIHAHAVDQLVRAGLAHHSPTRSRSGAEELALILLLCIVGVIAGMRVRPALLLAAVSAAAITLLLTTTSVALLYGWWVPPAAAGLGLLASIGGGGAYQTQLERGERKLVMQLFGRFVSRDIAAELWAQRDQFMEGGKPRPRTLTVTVMMTDLKGYTAAAENMGPERVTQWINSYMRVMTAVVERYGGIVEDFAGDGLKITFGAPIPRDAEGVAEDAQRATECALEMSNELITLNTHWNREQLPTARLRIGIHTGAVIAGSLGGADRMTYKTVGDTVNTAQRLESFDKPDFEAESAPTRILVSESTQKHLGNGYRTQQIGEHRLRGKQSSVSIYRVYGRVADGESTALAANA